VPLFLGAVPAAPVLQISAKHACDTLSTRLLAHRNQNPA
jgi:hypothetical protein